MDTVEVHPNSASIAFRLLYIALAVTMVYVLLRAGLHASTKDRIILTLICLLPVFLLLLPALRGLIRWPIRLSYSSKEQVISMTTFTGPVVSIPFSAVREIQPKNFWHGGRTSFEGFILHIQSGRAINLSGGNLSSVVGLKEALTQAGVPVVERTATGRPLKR